MSEEKRDPAFTESNRKNSLDVVDNGEEVDETPKKTLVIVPVEAENAVEKVRDKDFERRKLKREPSLQDVMDTFMKGSEFIGNVVASPISTLAPGLKKNTSDTFLCQICFCNEVFDEKAIELKCGHKFCRDCLGGWLRTGINNGATEHTCFYREEHPTELRVVFKPGEKLGMTLSTFGAVLEVEEGGLADQRGVKRGFGLESIEEIEDEDAFYDILSESTDPVEKLEKIALGPWTAVFDTYNDGMDSKCQHPIDSDILKSLLGEDLFKKHERFKRFAENEHLRECPWPNCDEEQVGDPQNPCMVCTKCEREYCYNHSNAHPGQTCEEFEAKMFHEYAKNRRAAGGKVIECPGCGRDIQKSSGCNHMTCFKCNTEFCWICGKVITGSVYEHYQNTSCYQFRYESFPWIEVEDDDPLGIWGWFALYVFAGIVCGGPIFVYWTLGLLMFIPVFTLRLIASIFESGELSSSDLEDIIDESSTTISDFLEALVPIACSCIFGWIFFGPLLLFACLGVCCIYLPYMIWRHCIRTPQKAFYAYFDGSEIDCIDNEYRIRTVEGEELLGVWHSLNSAVDFLESRRSTGGVLVVSLVKATDVDQDCLKYQITLENGEVLPTTFDTIEQVKKFLLERKQKRQEDGDDIDDVVNVETLVETPKPDPNRILLQRFARYESDTLTSLVQIPDSSSEESIAGEIPIQSISAASEVAEDDEAGRGGDIITVNAEIY